MADVVPELTARIEQGERETAELKTRVEVLEQISSKTITALETFAATGSDPGSKATKKAAGA